MLSRGLSRSGSAVSSRCRVGQVAANSYNSTFHIQKRHIVRFFFRNAENVSDVVHEHASNWFMTMLRRLGLISVPVTGDYVYDNYVETRRKLAIERALENGSPVEVVKDEEFVVREKELYELKRIMKGKETHRFYYLLTGASGTGKSTLLAHACQELNKGVLYVPVPIDIMDFATSIGNAIGFHFDEHIRYTEAMRRKLFEIPQEPVSNDPLQLVRRVLPVLRAAANDFKEKHGRPPVLIIDSIDRLVREAPKVVELLQDFAQESADNARLIVIFVATETASQRFLKGRTAWSRAELPPLEIGDLSDEEAVSYLMKRKVPENIAAKAVAELAGGRFLLLDRVADQILQKVPLDAIKQSLAVTVRHEFKMAGLLTDGQEKAAGWKVLEALLKSPSYTITSEELDDILPDLALQDNLLSKKVIKYHSSDDTISFKSRIVQTMAKELYPKMTGKVLS